MAINYSSSYNGSNYLSIPNYTGNPTTFSVSCWVYFGSQQSRIFFSNYTGWAVGISDSTANQLKFYLGSNTLLQSGTLTNNAWHHAVFTYDGTTAKIYVDGSLNNSLTSSVNYGSVPANNYIGTLNGSIQNFLGDIAVLGYWSKALSSTEVTSLYTGFTYSDLSGSLLTSLVSYHDFANFTNLGLDSSGNNHNFTNNGSVSRAYGVTPPSTSSYSTAVLADSPVAYYKLDEVSGTTTTDSSTNALNGTYNGGFTYNQSAAGSNTGVSTLFDGSTSYVEIPTNTLLHPTSSISLEAWINPTVLNSANRTIFAANYSSNISPFLDWSLSVSTDNSLRFYISTTTVALNSISTSLAINTWTHVVGTYDGSNMKLYVNGVLVATTPLTGSIRNTNQVVNISCYNRGGSRSEFFPGYVSNVALYSSALTATQILAHYDASGIPKVRVSQEGLLAVTQGIPKVRVSQEGLLVVNQGNPKLRISQVGLLAIVTLRSGNIIKVPFNGLNAGSYFSGGMS